MFKSARLKLTAWYLLIIMIISISFSAFIYLGLTREFDRILRIQEYRIEHPQTRERFLQRPIWQNEEIPFSRPPDPQVISGAKQRVIEGLALINLIILVFSSLAGYFLAGRTLRPIKNMVDEQNRFIADASHELNTPLTAIRTSIEVNLRNKKLSLDDAKKVLVSNLEEVNNLQLLSDELIKITQYQKSNVILKRNKISLRDVIYESVNRVSPMAKDKNIEIKVKIPEAKIFAEKRSLTELFTILLDNAVKYSKENKQINIYMEKVDSKIKIFVKDNGIGIDKKDLPFIFDRFYRADLSRTKQDVSGYGLGLAIAKEITKLHKGNIYAESVLGKGTTFIVILPTS